jgi:repressor LexA
LTIICATATTSSSGRENACNGEQVVALLDSGEATLKRFYKEGSKVRLQPANSTMAPRVVDADRVKVQGVVIGVLRSYQN